VRKKGVEGGGGMEKRGIGDEWGEKERGSGGCWRGKIAGGKERVEESKAGKVEKGREDRKCEGADSLGRRKIATESQRPEKFRKDKIKLGERNDMYVGDGRTGNTGSCSSKNPA